MWKLWIRFFLIFRRAGRRRSASISASFSPPRCPKAQADECSWSSSRGTKRNCGVESSGGRVVIKNERQYRITKAHAEKFRATLNELAATPRPKNVHPKLWEAQKAGLKSQLQDLEAELQEYETLKTGGPKILELDSLEGLPKMLIQARIAAGLTQEDLAARLGVKPQQIQLYEAGDYQTARFARLREIARLLRLDVRDRIEMVQK